MGLGRYLRRSRRLICQSKQGKPENEDLPEVEAVAATATASVDSSRDEKALFQESTLKIIGGHSIDSPNHKSCLIGEEPTQSSFQLTSAKLQPIISASSASPFSAGLQPKVIIDIYEDSIQPSFVEVRDDRSCNKAVQKIQVENRYNGDVFFIEQHHEKDTLSLLASVDGDEMKRMQGSALERVSTATKMVDKVPEADSLENRILSLPKGERQKLFRNELFTLSHQFLSKSSAQNSQSATLIRTEVGSVESANVLDCSDFTSPHSVEEFCTRAISPFASLHHLVDRFGDCGSSSTSTVSTDAQETLLSDQVDTLSESWKNSVSVVDGTNTHTHDDDDLYQLSYYEDSVCVDDSLNRAFADLQKKETADENADIADEKDSLEPVRQPWSLFAFLIDKRRKNVLAHDDCSTLSSRYSLAGS